MLKIMIVDDEMLSRVALRTMVEGSYQVVAEAADGMQAIAIAEEAKPDIVLADIIMPGTDGLSMISQLAEKLPLTRYIIISNVEQVDYLKKAIKMKVHDYLIKGTLTEEKLLSSLSELSKRILRERQNVQATQGQIPPTRTGPVLSELVDRVIRGQKYEQSELSQVFSVYGIDLEAQPYYCMILRAKDPNVRNLIERILLLNQEILGDCGSGWFLKRAYNELLCFYIPPEGENGEKAARNLAYRCLMTNQSIFGIPFEAGISQPVRGWDCLQKAFLQADKASRQTFYADKDENIYHFTTLDKDARELAVRLKQQVKDALQERSVDAFLNTTGLLEDLRAQMAAARSVPRETVVGLYLDVVYYAANFVRDTEVFDDLGEAMVALTSADTLQALHTGAMAILELAQRAYQQKNSGGYVKRVREYISQNISTELRVEEIAAQVHISANYLSQIFRQETGQTLRDYIAAERIRRAKDYLLMGKSLRETAILTGFSSDSYFVQKFKAAVDMTPKQFQKRKKR